MNVVDVIIIGAGLMGTSIARNLSRYELGVVVLEKGADVCSGSSKATSAIVHPGFDEKPGTLKAKLNIKGNKMFDKLCSELDVPFCRPGEIIVALTSQEMEALKANHQQGKINGVPGLRIIKREELLFLEPDINTNAKEALFAPTGAIVSPYELAIALMENAQDNGVELYRDSEVIDIKHEKYQWIVETPYTIIRAKYIVNTAGIYADKISAMAGSEKFTITPIKGEEYILDKSVGNIINHLIVSASIGFVIPTVHGNLMIGTTNVKTDRNDFNTTQTGFIEIYKNAQKLIPDLSAKDIIASFAGLRALKAETDDYLIGASQRVPNFINVSIGTPGVVATPAVAEMVEEVLKQQGLNLIPKKGFSPERRAIVEFRNLLQEEKDKLIQQDKRYGHVICRCETVTEGEIVEAIRRGARTLDGVKFRTRAGMGRCKGGFCTSRVIKILARELNLSITEITKKGKESNLLPYKTKELLAEEVI
jgi:glycerol-3-phosphate dehydrogenase